MASRIRLWSRSGILLYELSVPSFREWVLNDVGNASFSIKAAGLEAYITPGNYITIEHDELPDTYVGIITAARPWSSKVVTVNAQSAMSLFSLRRGSYQQPVSGSWGEVLSQLIGIVNEPETTLLRIGTYDDGISYSSIVDLSNPYVYLRRALSQSQTRLDFRPVVTNGKMIIYIDMQPALYTLSNLRLEEGFNIKKNSPLLIEQGEIYNDVSVMGVDINQNKVIANAIDPLSIELYGLRQFLFSEGQSQADVNRLATVRLAQYAYPRKTVSVTATNKANTFHSIRVGNSGEMELKSVGYYNGGLGLLGTAQLRVVQFDDKNGEAVLVSEDI